MTTELIFFLIALLFISIGVNIRLTLMVTKDIRDTKKELSNEMNLHIDSIINAWIKANSIDNKKE